MLTDGYMHVLSSSIFPPVIEVFVLNKYVVVCSQFEEWNLMCFLLNACARTVYFLNQSCERGHPFFEGVRLYES